MQHDNDNKPLTFISMFSGIEAASVAFNPLGWRALAVCEIDKAASALLAYRYPDVPNLGDMSKVDWSHYNEQRLGRRVDVVCGGPPCQAFSVAGMRRGMEDDRGNLSLVYMRALHAIKPRNAIVENVPGWLSMPDNAFGCFLAGLVGADDALPPPRPKKWPNAGMVSGPRGRAAWCVLDAQHFGLAQRRKRVIVVADFGNGADPAAVLFERLGLSGYSPSSRETGERVAPTTSARTQGGGELGTDVDLDGGLVAKSLLALANSSHDDSKETYVLDAVASVGNRTSGPLDVATAINAHGGPHGRLDFESETFIAYAPEIARCDATREGSSQDFESTTMVVSATGEISHSLRPEGCDASEDGTGRGTPIIAFNTRQDPIHMQDCAQPLGAKDRGNGILAPVCFTAKDNGGVAAVDIAPTLRGGTHNASHQNGGVTPAVTVALRGREGGATAELGGSDKPHVLASAVRRLTPRECERLQGFPDDYTRIPVRKYTTKKVTKNRPDDMWEPAEDGGWWLMQADGPRYKQLGNSWAVPKFRWLGERIASHMPKRATNDNQESHLVA